jgi:hypothetical protein
MGVTPHVEATNVDTGEMTENVIISRYHTPDLMVDGSVGPECLVRWVVGKVGSIHDIRKPERNGQLNGSVVSLASGDCAR